MPLDYSLSPPPVAKAIERASELLTRVGLGHRLDHLSSQMSGGQQQRVAIARSLINQPSLLLADEPTGNLDSHTSVEILEMFRELNATGITVLLVTHDPDVATFADRTIHIVDGLIDSDSRNSGAPPHMAHFGDENHNGSSNGNGNGIATGNGNGNGHVHVIPAVAAIAGVQAESWPEQRRLAASACCDWNRSSEFKCAGSQVSGPLCPRAESPNAAHQTSRCFLLPADAAYGRQCAAAK